MRSKIDYWECLQCGYVACEQCLCPCFNGWLTPVYLEDDDDEDEDIEE